MVAYTKHLMHIFRKAGAEYCYENRVLLDEIVRKEVGMEKADAPDVWKKASGVLIGGNVDRDLEGRIVKEFVKRLVTGPKRS